MYKPSTNATPPDVAPVRLLLVDDDKIILDALSTSFGRLDDIDLVAAVDSGPAALAIVSNRTVDVVLLDVEMPNLDGIETAKLLRIKAPDLIIVMYTNFEHESAFARAMEAGAQGFLTKDLSFEALAQGVRSSSLGSPVISDKPVRILLDHFTQRSASQDLELLRILDELPDYLSRVLDHLVFGQQSKDIAEKLGLSEKTVRGYVSELLMRTDCSNRAQLAARATRAGYEPRY